MFITFSELAPVFVPQYLSENRNFVLIGTNEPKKEITFANMKTSPCFRLYHTARFCHGVWNVYMEFVNESAMDMSRFSTAPAYIDLKNLHESIKELTIRTSKPKRSYILDLPVMRYNQTGRTSWIRVCPRNHTPV